MKEYIERAALIDDFKHCGASKEIVDAIVFRINLHKAADVVEVRHGHWIELSRFSKCSKCGFETGRYEPSRRYCPECGARMNGKEDEHEVS